MLDYPMAAEQEARFWQESEKIIKNRDKSIERFEREQAERKRVENEREAVEAKHKLELSYSNQRFLTATY